MEKPNAPPELVAYLDAHALHHNIVVPGVPMPTVTKAAQAIGTDPASIVKSLLWQASDGSVALVIASGTAKIDPRKLAAATGHAEWTLAPPDMVQEVTGFAAGGVPPVGPGYGERFPVLIDAAVMAHPVVFGGGGHEGVLLAVLPAEIASLVGAEVHDLTK